MHIAQVSKKANGLFTDIFNPNTKVSINYSSKMLIMVLQTGERLSTEQMHTNKGASKREGGSMHGGSSGIASTGRGDRTRGAVPATVIK